MDKDQVSKQNKASEDSTSTLNDNSNQRNNNNTHNSETSNGLNGINKPSPNKKNLLIKTSSLDRHPSGRHLSEQLTSTIPDMNANSFSGVNVILASPHNKTTKPPFELSIDHVDNKLHDSSNTYYIKNKGKTVQLTANAQNTNNNSLHLPKTNTHLSFSNAQKMLDDKITLSIQNKEGFDKIEETISLFHLLRNDKEG